MEPLRLKLVSSGRRQTELSVSPMCEDRVRRQPSASQEEPPFGTESAGVFDLGLPASRTVRN